MKNLNPELIIKKETIKKPNFFIVGAQRSGTTTLYHVLKSHSDVFMSQVKEPCFFIKKRTHEEWKDYLKLFQKANKEKIIGEASTIYFHNKNSPYLVKNKIPHPKILIQLRDPVERTISAYRQNKKKNIEQLSLKESLLKENERIKKGFDNSFYYFKKSFYYSQVKRFYDVFGKDDVKITIFEEFIKDPEKILNEIALFLKIDNKKLPKEIKKYNPGNEPKSPFLNDFLIGNFFIKRLFKIVVPVKLRKNYIKRLKEKIYWSFLTSKEIEVDFSEKDKEKLRKIFIPDIEKLQGLIKKDLSCWMNK
jgi:hypothetical protein